MPTQDDLEGTAHHGIGDDRQNGGDLEGRSTTSQQISHQVSHPLATVLQGVDRVGTRDLFSQSNTDTCRGIDEVTGQNNSPELAARIDHRHTGQIVLQDVDEYVGSGRIGHRGDRGEGHDLVHRGPQICSGGDDAGADVAVGQHTETPVVTGDHNVPTAMLGDDGCGLSHGHRSGADHRGRADQLVHGAVVVDRQRIGALRDGELTGEELSTR